MLSPGKAGRGRRKGAKGNDEISINDWVCLLGEREGVHMLNEGGICCWIDTPVKTSVIRAFRP